MNINTSILLLFLALAFIVFLFFVTRELWCWYFKINERISIDKEILEELRVKNHNGKNKIDILS
jgi:hypothetical protein